MNDPAIIFEDNVLLVIDKPAGMVVHPSPGHESEPAVTRFFLTRCPQAAAVGSRERPGVVHRLDQWTSGVLVLAKTQAAYLDLRRQFERHDTVEKTYLAVCRGIPKPREGTITEPIRDGSRFLEAVSHYRVLGSHDGRSMVEFRIDTGRKHQIRIHAASMGHPIVGDAVYGKAAGKSQRHLLHAVSLAFLHPVTHRRVEFIAPPPPDLIRA